MQFIENDNILFEFIDNKMIELGKYVEKSDKEKRIELAAKFFDDVKDYLNEHGIETKQVANPKQFFIELSKKNPNIFDRLISLIESPFNNFNLDKTQFPSWYYLSNAELIKNQWLIHFTNDAEGIINQGFKGIRDISTLGLTKRINKNQRENDGYNFAYTIDDFDEFGKTSHSYRDMRYKYGKNAILFKASGIKIWHKTDVEPQVIFRGNRTSNKIPITLGSISNLYEVKNKKTGDVLYKTPEMMEAVKWIINNFDTYRKVL